jgi:hypothetical protein
MKIAIGSEQDITAGPWMYTELILILCMSISPASKWRGETSSLLVFMRGIDMLNARSCLFELLAHSSYSCISHKTCNEVFSQSPSPEQTMGGARYYIEP